MAKAVYLVAVDAHEAVGDGVEIERVAARPPSHHVVAKATVDTLRDHPADQHVIASFTQDAARDTAAPVEAIVAGTEQHVPDDLAGVADGVIEGAYARVADNIAIEHAAIVEVDGVAVVRENGGDFAADRPRIIHDRLGVGIDEIEAILVRT